MLLVIPGKLILQLRNISFRAKPATEGAGRIATLLGDPGQLFLVKTLDPTQSISDHCKIIICANLALVRFTNHRVNTGAWLNSCAVFTVSPSHDVHYPNPHGGTNKFSVSDEYGNLSLSVGSTHMYFTEELRFLCMKTESSILEYTIEELEVWGK